MKLSVRTERLRFEAHGGAGTARVRSGVRDGVLLRLHDEDGREGLGEATPLPGYSDAGDTVEACERFLARVGGEALPNEAPAAARFAYETAVSDLVAQRAGVPLCDYLAGRRAAARIERNALLPTDTVDDALWVEAARTHVAQGFRTLKAKVGREGRLDDELRALACVRRAVGSDVALRADANRAWSRPDAVRALTALADPSIGAALVEEPSVAFPHSSLGVSIAADESLRDGSERARLAIADGCAAYVLKPAVLGGLRACLSLAEVAWSRGRSVLVTHLFDGPVALAAAAHLALALAARGPVLASGLDVAHAKHLPLSPWIASAADPSRVHRPASPGLGALP